MPTTRRSARLAARATSVRARPGGLGRRPDVGVPLAQAGHRLGHGQVVSSTELGVAAAIGRADQRRRGSTSVVQDADRQPAQAGLAERELQDLDRSAVASTATTTPSRTSPGWPGRCTTTGHAAWRTTLRPTDPNRWLSAGPRPREPSTTRCASSATSSSSVRGSVTSSCSSISTSGATRCASSCACREQRLAVQAKRREGPGLDDGRVVAPTRRHRPHRADEPHRPPLEGRLLGRPPDGLAGQGRLVDADDDAVRCAGCSSRAPHVDGGVPLTDQHPGRHRPAAEPKGAPRRDQGPSPRRAALPPDR